MMKPRLLSTFVAVLVLASACTGADKPTPGASTARPLDRDPGTLVVAVDALTGDFDIASSYLGPAAVMWRGIYEGLVGLKGASASEVRPMLADSWSHDPSARVWTFH